MLTVNSELAISGHDNTQQNLLVSMPSLCVPPGEKRSGERSRISRAYSQKVVRTNEIVRLLIIIALPLQQ